MSSVMSEKIWGIWDRIWFKSETTFGLDVIRAGLGLSMFFAYAGLTGYVDEFYSNQGWVGMDSMYLYTQSFWHQSILFYLDDSLLPYVHYIFLLSCLLFAAGWKTRWVKWLVLILHVSYAYRNPLITYGVDSILSSALLILCFAPIGRSFSIDRWQEVRKEKLIDLTKTPEHFQSNKVFMFRRLLQIQMAIFFLFAGVEKLRGDFWWSGDALWIALNNYEFSNVPLSFFAEHYWIINILTYTTLLLEMGYFYLIWQRATRPWILSAAILLHVGIAILMGLYYFSIVMIFCHLSFIRREWYDSLQLWWINRVGEIEIIYDGDCGFCKRSMAWLLAFDGLNQITVRDYRRSLSDFVSKEESDRALFAISKKKEKYAGFFAYRYVVLRVPGLWWLIPFFYLPVVSQAIGSRVYNWVASHRHVISSCVVGQKDSPQ